MSDLATAPPYLTTACLLTTTSITEVTVLPVETQTPSLHIRQVTEALTIILQLLITLLLLIILLLLITSRPAHQLHHTDLQPPTDRLHLTTGL